MGTLDFGVHKGRAVAWLALFIGLWSTSCVGPVLSDDDFASGLWALTGEEISSLPACQEPSRAQLFREVDTIFRKERGIPIEIAFALFEVESGGTHCSGGKVRLSETSGLQNGRVGLCDLGSSSVTTSTEVVEHAARNTDLGVHLRACAEMLDAKWNEKNRTSGCRVSDLNCVEKELLEEWLRPLASLGATSGGTSARDVYIRDIIQAAQFPKDASRVPPVRISHPAECVPTPMQGPGLILAFPDNYSTGEMKAGGCSLHLADGYAGFLSYTGYDCKITSGWGPGSWSRFHRNSRAVDIAIGSINDPERGSLHGDVRTYGIPILCPFEGGCEVFGGTFFDGGTYQWVRYRRADGYRGFTGRGGWEVLHVAVIDNGEMCRSEFLNSTSSFTKSFGQVIAYTARTDEAGYGFVARGAGPHVHLARCANDESFFASSDTCNGSSEPFSLSFVDMKDGNSESVYSSSSLKQTNLSGDDNQAGGEVRDFEFVSLGQGSLPASFVADAKDCCAPRCEDPNEDLCSGHASGWWCLHELDPDLTSSTTRVRCSNNRRVESQMCDGACQDVPGDHSRCSDDSGPGPSPSTLPAPELLSPDDDHEVSSSAGPPECQWSPPSGATTCRIVATDSLANVRDIRSGVKDATNCNEGSARSCLLTQKLTGSNISSHRLSSGLIPEGQNIYWFVRCGAEGVDGEWSPARRFRLRSSDPDPVEVMVSNVSPSSGSYRMGGALTVTWDANAAMTDEMLISLKRDAYSGSAPGGDYVVLATGTANDGAQTFTIPTNLNAASDWRIYVKHVMSGRWAAASGTVSVMSPSEPASCPSGNGDYCGDENGNDSGNLYRCVNGTYSLEQQCSHGCSVGAPGQNDTCSPAPASCPSGNGDYCGDENGNNSGWLYTCTNGTYSLKQQCSHGCSVGAPGQNDTCSSAPASCPSGNGDYCGDENGNDSGNLYRCSGGVYSLKQQCSHGCSVGAPGQNDTCASAPASCPSGNGDYCGDENGNDSGNLYRCVNGTYSLEQQCSHGCSVGAPGQNDTCSPAPASCPSGNGDYCGDENGNNSGWLYTCTNGTYSLEQQCSHGCSVGAPGQNDTCSPAPMTCNATQDWSPNTMSASSLGRSHSQSIDVELEINFRGTGSAGQVEFQVCKFQAGVASNFLGGDIAVYFEEWATHTDLIMIDQNVPTSNTSHCTGWHNLSRTHNFDEGDALGGEVRIVSPAHVASDWGHWCGVSGTPGGYCWFINTSTISRTCR